MQPIVVRPAVVIQYDIIAVSVVLACCKLADLTQSTCYLFAMLKRRRRGRMALIENIQREDLTQ